MTLSELILELQQLKTKFGPFADNWPVIASNGEWDVKVTGVELVEYSTGTFVKIEVIDD